MEKKLTYDAPILELIHFNPTDVITASDFLPPEVGEWDTEM